MRKHIWWIPVSAILLALAALSAPSAHDAGLEDGFGNPPNDSRLRCYWWWLNGNTDEQTITRDLEAMKSNGYGGAMIIDAVALACAGMRTFRLVRCTAAP